MSTISSSTTTTTAYVVTADTTGALVIQTGATPTTAVTVAANQVVTLAQALPVASGGTGATTNASAAFALKGANSDITSLSGLTTALSVAQGGTGATTNAGAAFALKGANSDITSLSGLTTALSVAQGGTGATSASAARTSLGLVIGTDVLAPNGSGASLTALNATNISSGTLAKARLPTGSVLQVVNVQTQSLATSTVAIPTDDTIPQNTEGTELFTLAITPTSATSKLFIQVNAFCGNTPSQWPTIALFQDSTANALAVNSTYQATPSAGLTLSLAYFMTAGTTSSTTFKIRFGLGNTGAMQINGSSGSRLYGGVATTTMTIMEIAA